MTDMQYRAFTAELEVRQAGPGRRLITGRLVPYGVVSEVAPNYREKFLPGAFTHQLADPARVKFYEAHSVAANARQIGHAVALHETRDGLYGDLRVVPCPDGDRILALAAEGSLSGLSIGFWSMENRVRGGVTEQVKARAFEVAALGAEEPAYADAQIISVRSREPRPLETPRRDRWKARFAG